MSWATRFDMRLGQQISSLVYPLDTFSMYSGIPFTPDTSHLLVRDAQGEVHHVESYRSFDCNEPVRGDNSRCKDSRGLEYHFEDLARYIESHSGPGNESAEIITRTWQARAGAAPVVLGDCIVAHCRVAR